MRSFQAPGFLGACDLIGRYRVRGRMENQTAENMENEMDLGVIHKLALLPMYPQFSDNVFLYI